MLHGIAALASVVLAAAWGRSVLGGWWPGVVLALVLASAPVFVSAAASASNALLPLPFAMTWLLATGSYDRSRRHGWLILGGAALGAGLYTHHSAVVLLPCFAVLTVAALVGRVEAPAPLRALLMFGGAFAIAALPFAVNLLIHPDQLRDQVMAYGLYDARRFNPLQGAREVFSWVGLSARTEIYWDYLDPVFLFLSGRMFWWPLAILVPAGVISLQYDRASLRRIVIGGLLLAPVAGALLASKPVPSRMLLAAPFVAALAVHGLIHAPSLLRRLMTGPSALSTTSRLPGDTSSPPAGS